MFLVNADYRTIRCVASPDNDKEAFINPEYLRLWPLERAVACETHLACTTLLKRLRLLAVQLPVRTLGPGAS